ncbi:MAG: hypothetical protein LQ340_005905 [Diploschistes diacapsis]|nr:MAG: hypothetical protein LQ340_005905 [Diploschistes diacapsis]
MLPERQVGFICPFEDCRQEHAVGDCSNDVTLTKILERVSQETRRFKAQASNTPTVLDENLHWRNMMNDAASRKSPHSQTLHGGRLLSTFAMVELGELIYDSEVTYRSLSPTGDPYKQLDVALLDRLKDVVRGEAECEVCYGLMLEPVTTPCGHSFCRQCVARILDHSATCPICRRSLSITPGVTKEPSNKRLAQFVHSLCADEIAARIRALNVEPPVPADAVKVPLFVCTLSYPEMPTFLHIFEPRYRLMIRRAIESDRKFGMVAYNGSGEEQGELGMSQFLQYGTLLHIENMQMLPDGRSLVETRGVSRFKIVDHDVLDGYGVGTVERVDDIPLAEEEALEAAEVSMQHPPDPGTRNGSAAPLASLSTADLMHICRDFVDRMREVSAPWLSANVLHAYGNPPTDPAIFSFWLASVLPIKESEKYRLLPTRSVRERLKIAAHWVRRVQGMR